MFIVFVFSRSVIRARVAPCSDSDADSERIRACRHAGRRGKKELHRSKRNHSSLPWPWSVSHGCESSYWEMHLGTCGTWERVCYWRERVHWRARTCKISLKSRSCSHLFPASGMRERVPRRRRARCTWSAQSLV